MAIIEFQLPEDSDLWPCPEACGNFTEDPYGGPCRACWRAIIDADREARRAAEFWLGDTR
jgi:hypothetical protein